MKDRRVVVKFSNVKASAWVSLWRWLRANHELGACAVRRIVDGCTALACDPRAVTALGEWRRRSCKWGFAFSVYPFAGSGSVPVAAS